MATKCQYAIISDIHANIEALDAVLKDAKSLGITNFLCLGDIVGYNASPVECVERIRELKCPVVCGNHDYYCSNDSVNLNDFQPDAANVIDWTRRQLSYDDTQWLKSLPMVQTIRGFTIVHSTLDNPVNFRYALSTTDAIASFNEQQTTVCFHGHTHVPCIFRNSGGTTIAFPPQDGFLDKGRYFINVGSVGQPRDGHPEACYLIYTTEGLANTSIAFRRVDYDIESAVAKLKAANLPESLMKRLEVGE